MILSNDLETFLIEVFKKPIFTTFIVPNEI